MPRVRGLWIASNLVVGLPFRSFDLFPAGRQIGRVLPNDAFGKGDEQ
jgi:hypothetical protein